MSGARYILVSATFMDTEVVPVGSSPEVFVGGSSGTVSLPLDVYGAQVKVVDLFGMPLGGVHVTLVTQGGYSGTVVTNSSGVARFNQIPFGTYTGEVSYIGASYSISQSSVGDNPLTVTVVLSYPLAGAALVVAAVSFYVVLRRVRSGAEDQPVFEWAVPTSKNSGES